jgi:ABC-type sugar transport system permease subunit
LSVGLHGVFHKRGAPKASSKTRKRNDLIFYVLMLAFPVAQFCIFYLGVNINSILLSFKSFDSSTGAYVYSGFENFKRFFYMLTNNNYTQAALNSLIAYAAGLVVGVPLALLFSYYIYKKLALSGIFKVFLFLPSIISSLAMVLLYKYFVDDAIPAILKMLGAGQDGTLVEGLLSNPQTTFGTILFYGILTGFGTSVLLYSGAMGGISESVVESARIEGATPLQEFFKITLPMIWPTLVTFLMTGVAGIFTNQMNLYSFYGADTDMSLYTFGYLLFRDTQAAGLGEYPYLAAMGLIMTFVAVPITLLVKWVLEKCGPRAD